MVSSTAVPDADNSPSVVAKVIRLLSAFDGRREHLSLSELARVAGVSKTTAHRLVSELVTSGLVNRDEEGLSLGLRVFELGHRVPGQARLRRAALPVMEDLRAELPRTIHLAVREGTDALYIEILSPPRQRNLPSRVGGRLPAQCTGVGKALLAHAPAAALEQAHAYVEGAAFRPTTNTITTSRRLTRELAQVRDIGIAVDREECQVGLVCVASPIFAADGQVLAALSVAGPAAYVNVRAEGRRVLAAALAITRDLSQGLTDSGLRSGSRTEPLAAPQRP